MVTSLNNQSLNIDSLLTMKSTVSLVKTTAQAMINAERINNSSNVINSTDQTNSSSTDSDYVEEMDYNQDGKVTINEKLRYYTEKTAQTIRKSSSTNNSSLTYDDYKNVGMTGYYDAQTAIKYSKAISTYMYNQAFANNTKTNTFNIGV